LAIFLTVAYFYVQPAELKQSKGLFPEQSKQQCQDDADEDGGGERKVEGELLFFNNDITGKFAHPWNLISYQ